VFVISDQVITLVCVQQNTMPAPPPSGYAYGQPTCWTRMKTGFMIGFCVGVASGALFGGFSALRSVLQI